MYAKPLQIYKGIDNKIKLLFKNQDQKLVRLADSTIVFNLIDSTNYELVFSRAVNVKLDNVGQGYVVLEDTELDDIAAGIYNYSIEYLSGENEARVVYADDNYNAQGQARINDTVYPRFMPSIEPSIGPFYNNIPSENGYTDGNISYSNACNVLERVKSKAIVQTVQYEATAFTGEVLIQGSLSANMTAYPDDWFTITDRQFIDYTGCIYDNFVGKVGLIRFKVTTTSGSLDKILYRP